MEKQTVKAREAIKRERKPLSSQNRIEVVGDIPGFKTRIVKDIPGRIDRFLDAGWEPVGTDEVRVGTSRANVATPESDNVNYIDLGGGERGLLMKQPKEWNDEDVAIRQKQVDEQEKAIKKPALEGQYGSIEIA